MLPCYQAGPAGGSRAEPNVPCIQGERHAAGPNMCTIPTCGNQVIWGGYAT